MYLKEYKEPMYYRSKKEERKRGREWEEIM